jgi:4-oxalocrotonate tautomerase
LPPTAIAAVSAVRIDMILGKNVYLRLRRRQMPIVELKLAKGRTVEQKRAIVEALTESCVSILKVEREWVSVVLIEFERENWGVGGELLCDMKEK